MTTTTIPWTNRVIRRSKSNRRGNFDDAASLAHAFEGASQVLIVSIPRTAELGVRLNRTAIDTAKAVGAQRILYTSHMGANPASPFPPMRTHAAIERALQGSGVPFTALRNGYCALSGVWLLGDAVETGEVVAPEDGPVAWPAHADLARAAAIALTGLLCQTRSFVHAWSLTALLSL